MDIDKLIARINELSRKKKMGELTEEELAEQAELRKQYLQNFRSNFRQELDRIEWADEEGK